MTIRGTRLWARIPDTNISAKGRNRKDLDGLNICLPENKKELIQDNTG
jgi:hypothetical protein